MDHPNETQTKYPEWKAAAERFKASSFMPGDLLTFEWLYAALCMRSPYDEESIPAYERARLLFLERFKSFEAWLLEEQNFALQSVIGKGYRIVKPNEQAPWAIDALNDRLRKELKKAGRRVQYVRFSELSDDGRREYVDSVARLGAMRGAIKTPRRIPSLF